MDWLYKNTNVAKEDIELSLAYYNGGGRQAYRYNLYRKELQGIKLKGLERHFKNMLAEETKEYVAEIVKNDSLFNKIIKEQLPTG